MLKIYKEVSNIMLRIVLSIFCLYFEIHKEGNKLNLIFSFQMTTATPVFDLSQVYNAMTTSEDLRVYKNGLVKMEIDHGKLFPPSTNDSGNCFLNEPPRETRCNRAR